MYKFDSPKLPAELIGTEDPGAYSWTVGKYENR